MICLYYNFKNKCVFNLKLWGSFSLLPSSTESQRLFIRMWTCTTALLWPSNSMLETYSQFKGRTKNFSNKFFTFSLTRLMPSLTKWIHYLQRELMQLLLTVFCSSLVHLVFSPSRLPAQDKEKRRPLSDMSIFTWISGFRTKRKIIFFINCPDCGILL